MRPVGRAVVGAVLALFMVGAVATPGVAAQYPRPRAEQWWFTAWAVRNKVWPITQGKDIVVAVIDSGVQAGVPDLSGAVLAGTDIEGGGGDGRTDLDTDGTVPGHGTAMASLIVSQGTGTGFVGVAPQAKVLPIAQENLSGIAPGIRYAVDHGAKVVNISQVAPTNCPQDIQDAVAYALQRDVVVVAGAGNEGDTTNASNAPANCAGVLAVGAVDPRLRTWVKTQRQSYVTVAAPGVDVGGVLKDGKYYDSDGGTSSAAALTSAAVALVRSENPQMPAREVVQRIIASTRDAGPRGKDNMTGYGAVRPYQALTMRVPKNAPNPVFAAYDKWAAANGEKTAQQQEGDAAVKKRIEDAGDDTEGFLIAMIPVAVLLLMAIFVIVFAIRWGRRRAMATATPGYPGTGQPQGFGAPQGPPQGFGGGQNQPPQPGTLPPGTRPNFAPPPGPPPDPGSPQGPPH